MKVSFKKLFATPLFANLLSAGALLLSGFALYQANESRNFDRTEFNETQLDLSLEVLSSLESQEDEFVKHFKEIREQANFTVDVETGALIQSVIVTATEQKEAIIEMRRSLQALGRLESVPPEFWFQNRRFLKELSDSQIARKISSNNLLERIMKLKPESGGK